jgi:hypothetical protein
MNFRLHIPNFATSTVQTRAKPDHPVLDGSDVVVANHWKLPPHTVALIGRPAVWIAFDLHTPAIPLGFTTIAPRTLHWEEDFGGHLFVAVTGADAAKATIYEAGPKKPDGSGALVPFAYPEDTFAQQGRIDFAPRVIAPPNGLSEEVFAALVRTTQRAYDGDQWYTAIEIPFLRVGRDSNSYASGLLLCCGIDARTATKVNDTIHYEWTGYPGGSDPVHFANFGTYYGAPAKLDDDAYEMAHHDADGSVRLVMIGGTPNARVRLPSGAEITLDDKGRLVLSPHDAQQHGLPTKRTDPPDHIVHRRKFPDDAAPGGALITVMLDDRALPLAPGTTYRGTVLSRNDALGIATLQTSQGELVLSLSELGVELRDPKRVDALFREGVELTVGLARDRHPRLVAHGTDYFRDRLRWRRFHAPRPVNIIGTGVAVGAVLAVAIGAFVWLRSRDV